MIMTFLVIHGLVCDHDAYWSFMDWFVIMTFLVIHRLVCDHDVFWSFMDSYVIMTLIGHSWTGL